MTKTLKYIVFLAAFLIRFMFLGRIPEGLSPQEASFGIFLTQFFNHKITDQSILRLPFALLGILSVYVFYLLIRKYSKNIKFALVSSFLLTVAPWHIIESRIFSWGMIVFTLVTAGLLLIPQNNKLLFH